MAENEKVMDATKEVDQQAAVTTKIVEEDAEDSLKIALNSMMEKLEKHEELPILFVGAGITKSFFDVPDWKGLLYKLIEAYEERTSSMDEMEKTEKKFLLDNVKLLIAREQYEEAAQELSFIYYDKKEYNYKDYNAEKLHSFALKNEISKITGDISPLIQVLTDEEKLKRYNSFKNMNPDIIITTNFDNFLEKTFDISDSNILYSQSKILTQKLAEGSTIYKIHGSSTPIYIEAEENAKEEAACNSIIIAKEDYDKFLRKDKYIYSKLLTLMVEHPVIFLGYNIGDRNIKEIISIIYEVMTEKQRTLIKDQWFFINYTKDSSKKREEIKYTGLDNNIELNSINLETKEYTELYNRLTRVFESKYQFSLEQSLVGKLIETIYSVQDNAQVVIRELYQNALDACKKYQSVNDKDSSYTGQVLIEYDDSIDNNITFSVLDNGIGMNVYDINKYFLRIGASSKDGSSGEAGAFGIGFLSSFAIADTIRVYTKKDNQNGIALEINNISEDDEEFDLAIKGILFEADKIRDVHGTRVELSTLYKKKKAIKKRDLDTFFKEYYCFNNNRVKIISTKSQDNTLITNDLQCISLENDLNITKKYSDNDIEIYEDKRNSKGIFINDILYYTNNIVANLENKIKYSYLKKAISNSVEVSMFIPTYIVKTTKSKAYFKTSLDRGSIEFRENFYELIYKSVYEMDINTFFHKGKNYENTFLNSKPNICFKGKKYFVIEPYKTKREKNIFDTVIYEGNNTKDMHPCVYLQRRILLKDYEESIRYFEKIKAISYKIIEEDIFIPACNYGYPVVLQDNTYDIFKKINQIVHFDYFPTSSRSFNREILNNIDMYRNKIKTYFDNNPGLKGCFILNESAKKYLPKNIDGMKEKFIVYPHSYIVPIMNQDSLYGDCLKQIIEEKAKANKDFEYDIFSWDKMK